MARRDVVVQQVVSAARWRASRKDAAGACARAGDGVGHGKGFNQRRWQLIIKPARRPGCSKRAGVYVAISLKVQRRHALGKVAVAS